MVAGISSLGARGPAAVRGVRCRARRAATTRSGVPGQARHHCQAGKAWRRNRHEEPAAAAVGRGVPSMQPPPGDARRRHQRCRGVPPQAHSLAARFQTTARLVCRPQCESDQNFSVSWIIVAAISSFGTRGPAGRGVRCRAQRAAATLRGEPGEAQHPRQPDAGDAAAAAVRSLPLPPWGKACRPHNDRASTESLLIAAIMIQRRNIYDGIRD